MKEQNTGNSNILSNVLALISLAFFLGALLRAMVLVSVDKLGGSIWYFVIIGGIAAILAFLARK